MPSARHSSRANTCLGLNAQCSLQFAVSKARHWPPGPLLLSGPCRHASRPPFSCLGVLLCVLCLACASYFSLLLQVLDQAGMQFPSSPT